MRSHQFMFIDGENLLFRYQAMLAEGKRPRNEVVHRPDEFVWSPHVFDHTGFDFVRATYYTSVVGDTDKLTALTGFIKAQGVRRGGIYPLLHVCVFKKDAKAQKTRSVDINITIDALRHAFHNDADEFTFITGDSDFVLLVEAVMREGKYVRVMALSSGLLPRLQHAADNFWPLDDFFFE
jgi:uncharacterized LabA/DUF88 family protein